jgi:predicted transcriptional regulator
MKLAEYLVKKGISQAEASRQLDVTQVAIHQYIYRKSLPSGQMMINIYKWSGGQVNLIDWVREFDSAKSE